MYLSRFNDLILDSCSTEAVLIKNYEIQIFRSIFMHIQVYLCKVSFLTTLDIYKDYFKGRQKKDATWCKVILHAYCDQRQFALVHLFVEAITFVHQGFCNQAASWSSSLDELKNFAAKIFLKLVCKSRTKSVHRLVSHVLGVVHWKVRLSLHYKSNCVLG